MDDEDGTDGTAAADGESDVTGAEPVDPDAVRHVAELARVAIDDDEADRFAAQFAEILAYFETLDEVPAVESEPDLTNVLREDEIAASLAVDAALDNAPETVEDYFKGPRVS